MFRLIRNSKRHYLLKKSEIDAKVFKKIANPEKIIYIDPAKVRFRLRNEKSKANLFPPIMDGSWDQDVELFESHVKVHSIYQHFINGLEWKYTAMFKNWYPKRLKNEVKVLGCFSIDEILSHYEKNIDALYVSMKENGFLPPNYQVDPVYVYIGRHGEIIYSASGNHRLTISRILKLKIIPVLVKCRHRNWMRIRDEVNEIAHINGNNAITEHPDLNDII